MTAIPVKIGSERKRQRDELERQDRVKLIAEYDAGDGPEATLHALAAEILRYRRSTKLLAQAVNFAAIGAPFSLIQPGPFWRPKRRRRSAA